MKICWHCRREWQGLNQPSSRAACDNCGQDLHVCRNCGNYDTYAPRECREPNVEPVTDKERFNYCEEFCFSNAEQAKRGGELAEPLAEPSKPAFSTHDAWNKLFKKQ